MSKCVFFHNLILAGSHVTLSWLFCISFSADWRHQYWWLLSESCVLSSYCHPGSLLCYCFGYTAHKPLKHTHTHTLWVVLQYSTWCLNKDGGQWQLTAELVCYCKGRPSELNNSTVSTDWEEFMMNISQNSPAQVRHDHDPDPEPRKQHPVLGSHAELDRKSESNRKKIVTRKTRIKDHQLSKH